MTLSAKSKVDPPDHRFGHLRTATSSQRLNQIEKIRSNGVGDLVALPQLVVCGDQSAGKSSVLEGITGIPFPRQEGLCTRFPTEIILRHTQSDSTAITASIRPHSSRTQDVQQTLAAYRKDVADMSELPSIIQDVSRLMNIRGYSDDESGCAFASDALRIEITGPIGLHLSIVDLPGLISVSNEEQTDDDVEAVHDMVASYLVNSRTIILAVLQAGNDMANQPIIKLARKHDPQGQRTVGIITKPDLINQGAEAKIALVARNQDNIKLKLGFFLLKNPSPAELREGLTMDARAKRELRFFSSAPWATQGLDMDRVGAERLRVFLQQLLDAHIERELPKVRDEMKKKLSSTENELKSMGEARPTIGHIRSFLTNLSMRFYELLQAALEGNYHSIDADFFSENECSRLRALIQKTNTDFATFMREFGQRRKVSDSVAKSGNSEERNGVAEESLQLMVNKTEMMQWVKETYSRTRGKELPGNYNPALLAELYREQSQRWSSIAEKHVCDILHIVSTWISLALKSIIREDNMRLQVHTVFQDWVDNAETFALAEVKKLIKDEHRGPLTYNHYYTDNVQKSRLDAQKRDVRTAINLVAEHDRNGKLHVSNLHNEIEKFLSSIESRITVDMDEQACNEAMTELNAYYKVALKTFIDNVARQVVERHIVAPLPEAFSPNSVSQLSDEDLWRMGTEPEQQAAKRGRLQIMVQGLRMSLAELQRPL